MKSTTPGSPRFEVPPGRGGKYLSFALGGETYGLEVLKVREIIGLMTITRVPRTPAYVRGVINLRGQVITVVDLRSKFGMPPAEAAPQACVIVVEIGAARRGVAGIIVDRVLEVLDLPEAAIEDAPAFGAAATTDFVLGLGKTEGAVMILLNIDRVLGAAEVLRLADLQGQTAA